MWWSLLICTEKVSHWVDDRRRLVSADLNGYAGMGSRHLRPVTSALPLVPPPYHQGREGDHNRVERDLSTAVVTGWSAAHGEILWMATCNIRPRFFQKRAASWTP